MPEACLLPSADRQCKPDAQLQHSSPSGRHRAWSMVPISLCPCARIRGGRNKRPGLPTEAVHDRFEGVSLRRELRWIGRLGPGSTKVLTLYEMARVERRDAFLCGCTRPRAFAARGDADSWSSATARTEAPPARAARSSSHTDPFPPSDALAASWSAGRGCSAPVNWSVNGSGCD